MALVAQLTLTIKSPSFANKQFIPQKYTCDGDNINPEITIEDIPDGTKSLALIMDDPDAPSGTFTHWLMWNIPVVGKIYENTSPGIEGKNSNQENKYLGPCPPKGLHHYHFKLFALNCELHLPGNANKSMLLKAMEKHILAKGELIGLYKK